MTKRTPGAKLGAIGFCFGGGMTWRLAALKDPRLAAAAPFHGPLPDGADFTGPKAAVLAVHAERDARVNASRDAAKTPARITMRRRPGRRCRKCWSGWAATSDDRA